MDQDPRSGQIKASRTESCRTSDHRHRTETTAFTPIDGSVELWNIHTVFSSSPHNRFASNGLDTLRVLCGDRYSGSDESAASTGGMNTLIVEKVVKKFHTVVTPTQHVEPLEALRTEKDAGDAGRDETADMCKRKDNQR